MDEIFSDRVMALIRAGKPPNRFDKLFPLDRGGLGEQGNAVPQLHSPARYSHVPRVSSEISTQNEFLTVSYVCVKA